MFTRKTAELHIAMQIKEAAKRGMRWTIMAGNPVEREVKESHAGLAQTLFFQMLFLNTHELVVFINDSGQHTIAFQYGDWCKIYERHSHLLSSTILYTEDTILPNWYTHEQMEELLDDKLTPDEFDHLLNSVPGALADNVSSDVSQVAKDALADFRKS